MPNLYFNFSGENNYGITASTQITASFLLFRILIIAFLGCPVLVNKREAQPLP